MKNTVTLAAAIERVDEVRVKLRSGVQHYLRNRNVDKPATQSAFLKACPNVTLYEIRALYGTWNSFAEAEIWNHWDL